MSKRLLQITIIILSLLPFAFGLLGIIYGSDRFNLGDEVLNPNMDSQFRFLSTWYLGLAAIVWWMVPNIEKHKTLFRIICTVVFLGALSRLLAITHSGVPDTRFFIVMGAELLFPLLIVWQTKVANKFNQV